MKRIITVLCIAAALLGLAATPAGAIPVPGIRPISGCVFTASYDLTFDNGLAWSTSDENAFHTPMFRAGSCRHVMVISFGVYNAPACFYAKVNTYNENGTYRVKGSWVRFSGVGAIHDLRPTIDSGRLHRVYAFACEPFRARQFPPSFDVYSR